MIQDNAIFKLILLMILSLVGFCLDSQITLSNEDVPNTQIFDPFAEIGHAPAKSIKRSVANPDIVRKHVPTEELALWLHQALLKNIEFSLIQSELLNKDWIDSEDDWNIADFDGDGENDLLLTLYLEDFRATWGRPGDFWIVSKKGLIYQFFKPENYFCYYPCNSNPSFFMDAPQAIAISDVTGDHLLDVVLDRSICGAHTCTQNYYIVTNHFGMAESRLELPYERFVWGDVISSWYSEESTTIVMTYSELLSVEDVNGDQINDILIHGGAHGSVGSGIQNTRTEVWSWNGDALSLADARWSPTNYRVHLLWQGNDNYYAGNYDAAKFLFLQVISDDTLIETLNSGRNFNMLSYDSNRRFAAFRLLLIALREYDEHQVQYWQQWLTENYPETPTAAASVLLLDEIQNGMDLFAACEIVSDFLLDFETINHIVERRNPTGILYMDMGYANPSLGAKDVCLIVD